MFKQGEKFKQSQQKYKKLVEKYNLNLVSLNQLHIIDNLKSATHAPIIEGLVPNVGVNPVEEKNLAEKEKIAKLENEFNDNMNEYIRNYKIYLKELASRQSNLNSRLRNKVVTYSGNKYYVNNTGIAREFTVQSWKEKDNSCPNPTITISPQEFSRLSLGPPMNSYELCRSGGYNAKDKSSGTAAWVDNLGYKHLYSDFINRNKSCPAETTSITGIQFNAIPTGKTYGKTDTCNTISLDSPTFDKIVALNQKLISGVTEMRSEVTKMAGEDVNLDKDIKKQKEILKTTYSNLIKEQEKLKKVKNDIAQYRAEVEDQNLSVPSVQMHHAIWAVIGGAFIATVIYNINN